MAFGYEDFASAIEAWYSEVNDYQFGVKVDSQTPGVVTGHYTQVNYVHIVVSLRKDAFNLHSLRFGRSPDLD